MSDFTHLDEVGQARMVDVGDKPVTRREAVASGLVRMRAETLRALLGGEVPKGDVLAAARLAGIMGAKETARLVPLCHPLPLSQVLVELAPDGPETLRISCRVRTDGRTGVEMEALTGVSIAALTVYDMCKALDREMSIEAVRLEEKRGGRSGEWRRGTTP